MRYLLLLTALAARAEVAPQLVWSGPNVTLLGSPSPDGQWLSYVDAAELAVRGANETRRLTRRPAGSQEFAYFSIFAPDSRRLAYAWFNADGFYELRTTSIEGETPRVIYRNEETAFVQPCAWSPDGTQILTLLFRRDNTSQIAIIPASGGRARVLRSLPWIYPKKMDFSPDGRWIVYDRFRVEGRPERAVYLLAVDGGQETPLLETNASHLFPLWSPDGQRIYYVDEATADLYAVRVEGAQRAGSPERVAQGLGRLLPMAITAARDLYYGLRAGRTDVMTPAGAIKTRFPGQNSSPAWSADGQTLAYLSRRGTENYGRESRVIVLNRPQENDERELPWSIALMEAVGWESPQSLLITGADSVGREGTFRLNLESGEFTWLHAERRRQFGDAQRAWTVGEQKNQVWKLKLPAVRAAVPLGLDAFLPVPADNPLTPEKVALGKRLFFDRRLSRDSTIACATCHQPEYAFSDSRPLAVGVGGQVGPRRSPRLANRAYGYRFFWDGRAESLEAQVVQPIENPKEMDLPVADAAQRVGLSVLELQQALASYVRTILSGDSPYDRYGAGDANALTPDQRAGLALFRGKARCATCHVGPNLTDEKLHDTGLGDGAMKTPSLRDVARTPPYMHDGSLATLPSVIEHYQRQLSFQLTAAEQQQLVSFLHSLSGTLRDGY